MQSLIKIQGLNIFRVCGVAGYKGQKRFHGTAITSSWW